MILKQFSTFFQSLDYSAMRTAALRLAAVLLCLTVHETCHGLVAWLLGDETAKKQQRLSLNPLHHIDWLGLAAMLTLGFGWAKPVPVNMNSFRHPKQGMALTALAGPISNLLLAFIMLLSARAVLELFPNRTETNLLLDFLLLTSQLSVGLGVFNMLPVSPLDGSKVLFSLLPDSAYAKLMHYERYGVVLLYALVFFGALDGFLSRAVYTVFNAMVTIIFG